MFICSILVWAQETKPQDHIRYVRQSKHKEDGQQSENYNCLRGLFIMSNHNGHHNWYVVCLETQDLREPDYRGHLRLLHLLSGWDTDTTENTTDTCSQSGNERRFPGFLFQTWPALPNTITIGLRVPALLNSNNVDHVRQIKWHGPARRLDGNEPSKLHFKIAELQDGQLTFPLPVPSQ